MSPKQQANFEQNTLEVSPHEHAEEYNNQGYTLLKGCIDPEHISRLTQSCQSILRNQNADVSSIENAHIEHPEIVDRYFPRAHFHERLPFDIQALLSQTMLRSTLKQLSSCSQETDLLGLNPEYSILSWPPETIQKGFSGYHQDGPSSAVKHGHPHIWIPISDSRKLNFKIIPNTHLLGNLPHGMLGQFVKVQHSYVEPLIQNEEFLQVEVGDALIFSTRALHCLSLNQTKRICWSLEFICEV